MLRKPIRMLAFHVFVDMPAIALLLIAFTSDLPMRFLLRSSGVMDAFYVVVVLVFMCTYSYVATWVFAVSMFSSLRAIGNGCKVSLDSENIDANRATFSLSKLGLFAWILLFSMGLLTLANVFNLGRYWIQLFVLVVCSQMAYQFFGRLTSNTIAVDENGKWDFTGSKSEEGFKFLNLNTVSIGGGYLLVKATLMNGQNSDNFVCKYFVSKSAEIESFVSRSKCEKLR